MTIALELLHFTINEITAAPGALQKQVRLTWWTREASTEGIAGAKVILLTDSMVVPPQATDDEILAAIAKRKEEIGPTVTYVQPNPEANAALVGREG